MDKNTMWGFILMALVLIGFTWYSQPSKEQLQAQHEADSVALVQQEQAKKAEQQRLAAAQAQAQAVLQDSTSALFEARHGQEQRITLQNKLVKVTINSHGGLIEEAELLNYKDQQKQNVRLLTADDAHMCLSLAGKQENIITDQLYFQPVQADEQHVTMRLPLGTGSLDIEYRLHPDAYMVDMLVRANGIGNLFSPSMQQLGIAWTDRARQLEKGFDFEQRYACIRYHREDGKTKNLSETSDQQKDIEEALDWVAFKNQFF